MYVAADDTLPILHLPIDKIYTHWTTDSDGAADRSWLLPTVPLTPHRIETPVVVR